jgi:hypothetical protein
MDKLDKFLDKLAYYSIQSILWVGIAFWVVVLGIILHNAYKEFYGDPVIGTTDHGIIIRESDIKEEKE